MVLVVLCRYGIITNFKCHHRHYLDLFPEQFICYALGQWIKIEIAKLFDAIGLRNMPQPENRAALQGLLGMTTYLARYCPSYGEVTASLRQILNKKKMNSAGTSVTQQPWRS